MCAVVPGWISAYRKCPVAKEVTGSVSVAAIRVFAGETFSANLCRFLTCFDRVVPPTCVYLFISLCVHRAPPSFRTNTIILIDGEGNVTFTERTMLECDVNKWKTSSFEFKLEC